MSMNEIFASCVSKRQNIKEVEMNNIDNKTKEPEPVQVVTESLQVDEDSINIVELIGHNKSLEKTPIRAQYLSDEIESGGSSSLPDGYKLYFKLDDDQIKDIKRTSNSNAGKVLCERLVLSKQSSDEANPPLSGDDIRMVNGNLRFYEYPSASSRENKAPSVQYRCRVNSTDTLKSEMEVRYIGTEAFKNTKGTAKNFSYFFGNDDPDKIDEDLLEKLRNVKKKVKVNGRDEFQDWNWERESYKFADCYYNGVQDEILAQDIQRYIGKKEQVKDDVGGLVLSNNANDDSTEHNKYGISFKGVEDKLSYVLRALHDSGTIDDPKDKIEDFPKIMDHTYIPEKAKIYNKDIVHYDSNGNKIKDVGKCSETRQILERIYDNEHYTLLTQKGHRYFEIKMMELGFLASLEWENKAGSNGGRRWLLEFCEFVGIGKSNFPREFLTTTTWIQSGDDNKTQEGLLGAPIIMANDPTEEQVCGSLADALENMTNDALISVRKMFKSGYIAKQRSIFLMTVNEELSLKARKRLERSKLLSDKCWCIVCNEDTSLMHNGTTSIANELEKIKREMAKQYEEVMADAKGKSGDAFISECVRLYKANPGVLESYLGEATKTKEATKYGYESINDLLHQMFEDESGLDMALERANENRKGKPIPIYLLLEEQIENEQFKRNVVAEIDKLKAKLTDKEKSIGVTTGRVRAKYNISGVVIPQNTIIAPASTYRQIFNMNK